MLLSDLIPAAEDRFAERVAYQSGEQRLTYRELSRLTRKAAGLLQSAGLQPGDTVGILLRKSVETAVAFHAILRAAGVAVPLDPSAPTIYLKSVIDDCNLRFLFTDAEFAARIYDLMANGRTFDGVIGLDGKIEGEVGDGLWADWDVLNSGDWPFNMPALSESDPAYVVYTSGSSGRPKGILHSHRSGYAYARRAVDTYNVIEDDVISGFPPLHFDQSTFEMLAAPLAGATVSLIHDRDRPFPARLTEIIEQDRISIWYSVPTALVQMAERGVIEDRDLTSLRWVKFGGEVFPMRPLRQLMSKLPDADFSNVYGPAEINQCSFHNMTEPPDEATDNIPLGRMWPDAVGLVLDEQGRLDQAGEGELCVATPTMMSGYWGRSRETARSIIEHEWKGQVTRFYRTGDLVRMDEDGTFWFKGRIDHQVKARGYRVELEAVEAALGLSSLVKECAAFLSRKPDGTTGLLAAVVPIKPDAFRADVLRVQLKSRLAQHAIPEEFIVVESIPRNQNGKIDRSALQAMQLD